MFRPEPPQGFGTDQSLVVIGRPPIPLFGAPQGIAAAVDPGETFRVLATYPATADLTFEFYKFYQIQANQAPGLEINMPMVIIDSLPVGSLQDLTNGFDVRMFDSSGAAIPYESIDIVVNGDGSADFEIWFMMPTVADFEFVQLAFGKIAAGDGSNPNGVYDSDFELAFHMNQTSFGVNSIIDSSNGNDGNPVGTLSSVPVGVVGKAIRYDTDTTNIIFPAAVSNPMNAVGTVSMWVNLDDIAGGPTFPIFYSSRVSLSIRWEVFYQRSTDILNLRFGNSLALLQLNDVTSFVNSTQNHLYTFTWDHPNSVARIYIDGILRAERTVTAWSLSVINNTGAIGNLVVATAATAVDGFQDEVRYSSTIRSPDWIVSEFNNQNDNDVFWFKTPVLVAGEDNFIVDDLGNNLVTEIS